MKLKNLQKYKNSPRSRGTENTPLDGAHEHYKYLNNYINKIWIYTRTV